MKILQWFLRPILYRLAYRRSPFLDDWLISSHNIKRGGWR